MKNNLAKFIDCSVETFLILATILMLPFYFIKFKYNWVSLNITDLLILILLAAWLFGKNSNRQILKNKYNIPVLLIIAGLLLSTATNKNYLAGLGILKGWFIFPIIFGAVLLDNLKRDEKLMGKVFSALFVSGVLVSIEGVYYWLTGLLTFDWRLKIFFDSPNQLAMFLAPVLLIGMFYTRNTRRYIQRKVYWKTLLLFAGLVAVSLNFYLTKSYGAWLAVAGALGVVFWLKQKKKSHLYYSVPFAIILVILAGWAAFNKFQNIQNLGERSSLASRVMIWKSAGLMLEKNPLFGIGPGNFQNTYLEYQKYFPPYLEWAVPQPHNLFLAFWLETGFLGFIGFVWLLILFFKENKKTRLSGSTASFLCLGIILYYIFHGIVDTTYWRNDMAILFWTIIAVNASLLKNRSFTDDRLE